MGFDCPWADAYIQPPQNEQYYLIFLNVLSTIHQNIPGINPIGIGTLWANAYLQPQPKEKYSVMFINL